MAAAAASIAARAFWGAFCAKGRSDRTVATAIAITNSFFMWTSLRHERNHEGHNAASGSILMSDL